MFSLTWKMVATPARRRISLLRASGLRISGIGCIGWPTPNSGPQNDTDSNWENRREECKAKHVNGNGFGMTLGMASQLTAVSSMAGWATPAERDWRSNEASQEHHDARREQTRGKPLSEQAHQLAASGPTPSGCPAATERPDPSGGEFIPSSFPTPRGQDSYERRNLKTMEKIAEQGGDMTLPTRVKTMLSDNRGQLNPALSRWLQGYPKEWCEAAITAYRSTRKTRQRRG
jgi:hypothetical protein